MVVRTLLESAAARESGAGGAQGYSGFQNIFVVAAFGRVFAPQKNVRMRIDQSGQHGGGGKIDYCCVGGNLSGGFG